MNETADTRTFDSFITGAQQALARFGIAGRAHQKLSSNSFRFADQLTGDQPVTVFLVGAPGKDEAYAPIEALIQFSMIQEWKRVGTRKKRNVYLIANEATNGKIMGLEGLLTIGREFGIRIHIITQSLAAFRRVYGADATKTMLSETEIKQFPAGQREPDTLKLIETLLGQQSHMVKGLRQKRADEGYGVEGTDYREEGRAAMTADEIRRTDKSITFIRNNKALLHDLPPIAAIAPFRKLIGINPMWGKRWLLPVQIRVRGRDGSAFMRVFKFLSKALRKRRSST